MNKINFTRVSLPSGASTREWDVCLATWFGVGVFRPAPGTLGTLAAVPLGVLISFLSGPLGVLVAAAAIFAAGVFAAGRYAKRSGVDDDQSIVIDEVAGLLVAAIPAAGDWRLWVLAVLLFRLFDIWKPWPVSWADRRLKGGLGIMVDDILAGIYALFGVSLAAVLTLAS